jgi:hypothetical protein
MKLRRTSRRTGIFPLALSLLCTAMVSGCGHIGRVRPVALYPNPEQPRAAESLAHLQGPVAKVDGVDVEAHGTVFDLLPGCHVVTLRRKVGEGNVSGAWMADLGTIIYAFHMRPAFLYSIDVRVRFRGASHGSMTIVAEERDASGALVSRIKPTRRPQDIEECQDPKTAATLPTPEGPLVYPAPSVPMEP